MARRAASEPADGGHVQRAGRRGRDLKPPATPLGIVLTQWLAQREISASAFAQRLGVSRTTLWRLLQGRSTFTHRLRLVDFCRALGLNGPEAEDFMAACERRVAVRPFPAGPAADRGLSGGGLSGADGPEAGLTAFLVEQLRVRGLSRAEFARRVAVAPSTISRILGGRVRRTHRVALDAVARALGLDETQQRRLRSLALRAGLFALRPQLVAPAPRFFALEQRMGQSLDAIEQEVDELRGRRNQGEVMPVLQRIRALFAQLYDGPAPTSDLARAPELVSAMLRVGLEYCEAQAAALNWYARVPCMIRTCDRMAEEVLQHLPFPPKRFVSEYGHVINLRAPQYRNWRPISSSRPKRDAHEGIWELTWALDHLMPHLHEPTLQLELLRNRAHTYLVSGDARNWVADLEAAQAILDRIERGERGAFQALVTYSWGEGYKRIAALPQLGREHQRRYAHVAMERLQDAVVQFPPEWAGYALLAKIAEAQCLMWLDPDETLRRVELLRAEAQSIYPALAAKIERTAEQAKQHRRERQAR
jgi:transcriptional regulator with XRE-family HTH domain